MLEKQNETQGIQIAERVEKMGRENKAALRDGLEQQKQNLEVTVSKFREQHESATGSLAQSMDGKMQEIRDLLKATEARIESTLTQERDDIEAQLKAMKQHPAVAIPSCTLPQSCGIS